MKTKLTHQIFTALCAVLLITSCTIEKRRYTDGYHIERLGHKAKIQKAEPIAQELPNAKEEVVYAEPTASTMQDAPTTLEPALKEPTQMQPAATQPEQAKAEEQNKLNKKQLRKEIKQARQAAKAAEIKDPGKINYGHVTSPNAESDDMDTDTILLVILAILIPPLAVYLYEGSWTGVCWLNLILTILFWLPGVIHALLVVLEVI